LIGEMAKTHAANLEELTTKYKEWAGKLLRFNAWGATDVESIASQLQGMAQEALDYAADFALAAPVFDLVGDAAKISARRVRLDASRNSPATIAKREREEKRKEEKRRAALAESIAKLANDIAEWRAGTLDRLYATDIDGGAMLRIRGNNVETSQGASAPISHAARVLQAINVSRKYGRDTWTRSQSSQRDGTTLGHFTLDSYDASGIRAGCHFITWKEIDAIAPRILERAQPFTMAG